MIRYVFLFVCIVSFVSFAQKQNNNEQNQSSMTNDQPSGYKYVNANRPGYYLQINNQNCYYEIDTNNLSTGEYYGVYPSYSVRYPLNLQILKSGEQTISLKILPFKGEILSPKAHLEM